MLVPGLIGEMAAFLLVGSGHSAAGVGVWGTGVGVAVGVGMGVGVEVLVGASVGVGVIVGPVDDPWQLVRSKAISIRPIVWCNGLLVFILFF